MKTVLLLSGPVASGKTKISSQLVESNSFIKLSTSEHLKTLALKSTLDTSRLTLQNLGDKLDLESDYLWVINDVAIPQIKLNPSQDRWLLDAVRKPQQVTSFKTHFPNRCIHIHLTASENILRKRYEQRLNVSTQDSAHETYDKAITHPNEISARSLISFADLVLDTSNNNIEELVKKITSMINKG